LRRARGGMAVRGGERAVRPPGRGHAHGARGPGRAGGRPGPAAPCPGALRRQVAAPAALGRPRRESARGGLVRHAEGPLVIRVVKGHGLGNDYIVMEEADLPAPLTARQITRIWDRNWGVGSDGILLKVPAWDGADFGLRILNPDGSEAEKSGNGLRIFAKYLHDHGHAARDVFTVSTLGGVVECRCHVENGRMRTVTVEMGHCTFVAPEIPMNGPAREVVGVPLQADGETLLVTPVSVANPPSLTFPAPPPHPPP